MKLERLKAETAIIVAKWEVLGTVCGSALTFIGVFITAFLASNAKFYAEKAEKTSRDLERPAAIWWLTGTQELSQVPQQVKFNHEEFDSDKGGIQNNQQDWAYKAPVSGVYLVNTSLYIGKATFRRIDLRINGKDVMLLSQAKSTEADNNRTNSIGGETIVRLNKNDELSIWASASGGPENTIPGIEPTPVVNRVAISLINQELKTP